MQNKKELAEIEILIQIAKVLNELKIPYYIAGGYAVSVWGRPRFTADLDLIIKMSPSQTGDFAKRMADLFPTGYVDKEQIDSALRNVSEFNIIDPETGLKIDFFIAKKSDFEEACFKRANPKNVGYKVRFIAPEDLIISKLIWYKQSSSTRHLEDIKSILANSKIDKRYLNLWIKKLGLEKEYLELEKKNPA